MAPPRFQRLVIYGVGLLGGSLGMALRRRAMAHQIVGLGRSMERLERARQLGAIDEATTNPEEALAGADALITCLPPRQIRERWADLAPLIAADAFVTDVGSVKDHLAVAAEEIFGNRVRFIGSHPMAGSEKTGAIHARSDFFEDSACILTPTDRTLAETVALAIRFWSALGARMIVTNPERHDALLSGVSHLPHVAACALMQTLARQFASPGEIAAIAGGGLRDTTRIAAADPDIWKQIFAENAPALLKSLDAYLAILREWRDALDHANPDPKVLARYYAEGRDARLTLNDSPQADEE